MDPVRKAQELGGNPTDSPRSEERRAFPRSPVAIQGTCYGIWGSSPCFISGLSESGITVHSCHMAKVGEEFTVAWHLADCETPLQMACAVRELSDREVHLEFLGAKWTDRLRIRRFLRQKLPRENA